MVKIDDEWYHVDATWDDDEYSLFKFLDRSYFLKSDAQFMANTPSHHDWQFYGKNTNPIADSNKYEKYNFASSAMYYEGGKWYYYDEWKNYKTGVEFHGFVRSNIDESDTEKVLETDVGDYVVLNGKIYYTRSDIRWWSSLNRRNIFTCNIDGSKESLFKVVTDDEDAMISSLYILGESLGCDIHISKEPYIYSVTYDGLPSRITISSFTADKRSGQLVDTPVNLSVSISGGTTSNEYRFYYKSGSETYTIQDYSSSNTAVFCPKNTGFYDLYVDVKDSSGQIVSDVIKEYQIIDSKTGLIPFHTTHVQNVGWQNWVSDGEMSGTEGWGLRLEGIKIELSDPDKNVGITYSTNVQNVGWQDAVQDGKMSGTEGLGYRLEAIKINLTGTDADQFDIYYQVHAQDFGWMGWAKNGQSAGTAGYGFRLEGIRIKIVPKGSAAPGSTDKAFVEYIKKPIEAYPVYF